MRLLKQSSVLNNSTSPGLAVAHGLLSFENTVTWSVITCMMLILSLAAWHREVAPRGYRGLSACDADADEAILHLIGIVARIASAWDRGRWGRGRRGVGYEAGVGRFASPCGAEFSLMHRFFLSMQAHFAKWRRGARETEVGMGVIAREWSRVGRGRAELGAASFAAS